ncbi:BGP_1a_G0054220.mRNA.1.CDS.1 [Saccharomyces cerevisiae]|nr:BGP_1a_G0054220.mRNA.1.CDS.1 [Saccharomyces cerevisiae]CAI7342488.1 BGP_1a_G0054220.mRNA.1.CDS.1 [Saccharomyces cerevisiae]
MHPLVDELTLSRYLTHGTSVLSSSLYSVAFFLFFFALVPIINGEGKIRNIFEIGGVLLQSFYN